MRIEFINLVEKGELPFAQVCARFSISRKTGYKWLRRFREEGETGLLARSRAPRQHGRRTAPEVEAAAHGIWRAHPAWSSARVRTALADQGVSPLPALSTLDAMRRRTATPTPAKLQANDAWRLIEGPAAVAFGRQHRAFLVRDEATGCVLAADILPENGDEGRAQILQRAFGQHGLPGRLLWPTSERNTEEAGAGHSATTVALLRQGIAVEFVTLPTPSDPAPTDMDRVRETLRHLPAGADLSGFGRRTLATRSEPADALTRAWRESLPRWRGRLSAWVDRHNAGSPDASGAHQSPITIYRPSRRQWDAAVESLPSPTPTDDTGQRRRVSEKGLLHIDGQRWLLGRAFAGCDVDLATLPEDGRLLVTFAGHPVGWLELDATEPAEGAAAHRVSALSEIGH